MSGPLDQVGCARIPADALSALAPLRREPGISVHLEGDRAWVRWRPGCEAALRRIVPIAGAELFVNRDGTWHRLGAALPAFDVPEEVVLGEGLRLDRAIVPAPFRAEPPDEAPPLPARLELVRDDRPRAATALRCPVAALARWAESATSHQFGGLMAARAGDVALLLGRPLPAIAGAERFCGAAVLVPLGNRPDPDLPDTALLAALGGSARELAILGPEGVEVVPRDAFRRLSRAGARLAAGGAGP
jgi:hypothetical protein